MSKMIAAILVGRKGSKGFPDKNLYKVLGQPLCFYPLKAALDCPEVGGVYVSTDDERIMQLGKDYGAEIIIRPDELCTDKALGTDVYLHAYNTIKGSNKDKDIELLVLLMCNAACITAGTISQGIRVLRANPDYDSAATVSKYNMWSPVRARKIGKDGLLHPFIPFDNYPADMLVNSDRDAQGDAWFADMGVSIVRPECLEHMERGMLPQKWMGRKIYPLAQWGGFDVDYEWQIPLLEYWLRNQGPKR